MLWGFRRTAARPADGFGWFGWFGWLYRFGWRATQLAQFAEWKRNWRKRAERSLRSKECPQTHFRLSLSLSPFLPMALQIARTSLEKGPIAGSVWALMGAVSAEFKLVLARPVKGRAIKETRKRKFAGGKGGLSLALTLARAFGSLTKPALSFRFLQLPASQQTDGRRE